MKRFIALYATLAVVLALPYPALADGPANIAVNILHDGSQGDLRVNGVPVHRFGYHGSENNGPATDALSIGQWLVEGENVIEVDAQSKNGKPTRVVVVRGPDEPNLFEGQIAGSGKVQYKLSLQGVPNWGWSAVAPWTGDDKDLLAAVAALHTAYAKADVKSILPIYAAFDEDVSPYIGSQMAGAEAGLTQTLAGAKVPPLSQQLVVERFYGDRLFVVHNEDGSAPIQVMNESVLAGAPVMETGQYWIRKGGSWQIIRP